MSYNSQKVRSKHMRNSDKWQQTVYIDPCSQLHISAHKPPALGQNIQNWLSYVLQIGNNELDMEWGRSQTINI